MDRIFRGRLIRYLLIFTPVILYFYYFLNRGLIIYDEGYVFEGSRLILSGKLPYKDFFFQYPPLTIWIGAVWFKLFGVGILKLRLLALIISFASVVVGYVIANKIFTKWVAILVTVSLIAWGFPQTNFLWPSAVAILLLFLTIYLLTQFTNTNKTYHLFLTGIVVSLSLLNKQNLGVANLASSVAYIFYLRLGGRKFNFWWFFAGILLSFTPLLAGLSINGQLIIGIKEFFRRSLGVVTRESLFAPYPIFSSFEPGIFGIFKWFGKTFIYLFPIFLYFVSSYLAIRSKPRENTWYLIFFTTSLYFVAMVWPIADLAHLSFAIPAVIFSTAALSVFRKKLWANVSIAILAVILCIGFYKTFFMRYYTFETPYLKQTQETTINGEKFYLDKKYSVISNGLDVLKDTLFKDKTVFVHPYMPMFYYLIGKEPPVYELYTVRSLLSFDAKSKVISQLQEKNVDFVIIDRAEEKDSTNLVTKYITENYKKVDQVWDYDILEKE